jgi:hypothetical protein
VVENPKPHFVVTFESKHKGRGDEFRLRPAIVLLFSIEARTCEEAIRNAEAKFQDTMASDSRREFVIVRVESE